MNIDAVICEGSTPANLGENIFQYSNYGPYDITLIVPCGSKNTYETSDWKMLSPIIEDCPFITYKQEIFAETCDNDVYNFNDKIISIAGTYYDTIHIDEYTDSIYILTLTINPSYKKNNYI